MAATFDFLSLPGELRNLIYRFTLTTDPSDLDREHKYNCAWCTWNPTKRQHAMYDRRGRRLPGCRCWARDGLALLLANRQINVEGSSIFWAENQFTFQDIKSFTRLVGERLRPGYQQMIRNIIVLQEGRGVTLGSHTRFWIILFRCKSLRHLEIPPDLSLLIPPWTPEHHDQETAAWDYLTSMLPNLKTFAREAPVELPTGVSSTGRDGRPMTMRISKCWAIEGLSPVQLGITDAFSMRDALFARGLRYRTFPGEPYQARFPGSFDPVEVVPVSTERPHEYRCVVHEGSSMATWTVQRFLQPLSHEAIARNYMLRARDEERAEEERLKKAEMYEQATWCNILRSISLVLTGLGQPSD